MRFNDGLMSLSLGIGNKKKDLRYNDNTLTNDFEQLNTLWSSNWLAQSHLLACCRYIVNLSFYCLSLKINSLIHR